jgi:predicted restriction endonuclease
MRKTPLRKISQKQSEKIRVWGVAKAMALRKQYEEYGFCFCQSEGCLVSATTPSDATYILDAHHKVFRSQRGANDETNLVLLCKQHHREVHG